MLIFKKVYLWFFFQDKRKNETRYDWSVGRLLKTFLESTQMNHSFVSQMCREIQGWKQAAFLWSLSSKKKKAAGDLLITNAVYISSCVKPEVYQFHWNILSNFANRFSLAFPFALFRLNSNKYEILLYMTNQNFKSAIKRIWRYWTGLVHYIIFIWIKLQRGIGNVGGGGGVKEWWRGGGRAGKLA